MEPAEVTREQIERLWLCGEGLRNERDFFDRHGYGSNEKPAISYMESRLVELSKTIDIARVCQLALCFIDNTRRTESDD